MDNKPAFLGLLGLTLLVCYVAISRPTWAIVPAAPAMLSSVKPTPVKQMKQRAYTNGGSTELEKIPRESPEQSHENSQRSGEVILDKTEHEPTSPYPKRSPSPWKQHIRRKCNQLSLPTKMDVIKPELFRTFLVDDKYKVIFCQLAKVASSQWRKNFITMSGKVEAKDPKEIKGPVHGTGGLNDHLTFLSNFSAEEIRHKLRTYFKFMFVREPFERILSAYRNKFHSAYDSQIRYMYSHYGNKIIKHYRPNQTDTVLGDFKERISFSEYIHYLTDPDAPISPNKHWNHFHKLCLPCVVEYDFVGKLESAEKDSDFVFKKIGMDLFKFPAKTNRTGRKSTKDLLKEYYSLVSKSLLNKLWETYQYDSVIFNYTIPKVLQDLMR